MAMNFGSQFILFRMRPQAAKRVWELGKLDGTSGGWDWPVCPGSAVTCPNPSWCLRGSETFPVFRTPQLTGPT